MAFCSKWSLLIVLPLVTIYLAYSLYGPVPFPDQTEEVWVKYLTRAAVRSAFFFSHVGNMLGLGTRPHLLRSFTRLQTFVDMDKHPGIEEFEDVMAGVRVLVFRPKSGRTGLQQGLVYFHGGGMVLGTPDEIRPLCRRLATQMKGVVISVDYRLAPEHVFPAAIEDAIAVTEFFLKHSLKHGVDPHNIGLAGDSAGGNLAMGTALELARKADPHLPTIKFLGLFYPMMQMFNLNLPSYVKYEHGPTFATKKVILDFMLWYMFGNTSLYEDFAENRHTSSALKKSTYGSYVSTDQLPEFVKKEVTSPQSDDFGNETLSSTIASLLVDPRLSPIMAPQEQIHLLPHTYVLIPEFDVLRDDGFLTVARLQDAGVPVEVNFVIGAEHSLMQTVTLSKVAQETVKQFASFCRKHYKTA